MTDTSLRPHRSTLARWACAVPALFAVGCDPYPNSEERFDDQVVVTARDPDADFGNYQTFAVDPTVYLVVEDNGDIEKSELEGDAAAQIVAHVVRNMEAVGYREVAQDEKPDLGLTLTAINAEVSGLVTYWYGGYWGYYGWGYYYPYTYSYSYRTGSLVTDMVDLTDPPSGAPGEDPERPGLPVVWSSVAYEVMDGDNPDLEWAQTAIDQAFEQSPYLGGN